VLLALSAPAGAATLSLSPSSQTVGLGGMATADLVISGLGATGAPSLGGFEVEILFDDAVLNFSSATFGNGLGAIVSADPFDFTADAFGAIASAAGAVTLEEFSFLLPEDLDALQSDSFTLATLSFSGAAAGDSALSFGLVNLSNSFGTSIAAPALQQGALSVVPVPATAPLLGLALGLLGYLRHRRGATSAA
jgi:hypothetical protein